MKLTNAQLIARIDSRIAIAEARDKVRELAETFELGSETRKRLNELAGELDQTANDLTDVLPL